MSIRWLTVPPVAYSKMLHSIELYAQRVMPRVRRIVGACDRRFRSSSCRRGGFPMAAAPQSPFALVLLLASSITLADDVVTRSFCDTPPY